MPHRYYVNNIVYPNLDYLRFITTSFLCLNKANLLLTAVMPLFLVRNSVFDDNFKSKSIAYFCEKIFNHLRPNAVTHCHEMDYVS